MKQIILNSFFPHRFSKWRNSIIKNILKIIKNNFFQKELLKMTLPKIYFLKRLFVIILEKQLKGNFKDNIDIFQYPFGFIKLYCPIVSCLKVFIRRKSKIAYHKFFYIQIEIFQYFMGNKNISQNQFFPYFFLS